MAHTNSIRLILIVTSFITIVTKAQNFSYNLSSDTVAYSELAQPLFISNGTDWNNQRLLVPIGFTFNFLGQNFDSLTIEGNGFIVFDPEKNYAISTFKGLFCKQDSNGVYSAISKTISGSNGNHILKLQYKNQGFYTNIVSELFSYQVWLYEQSGNVEFHIGPNPANIYAADSTSTLVGLINLNQDTNPKAYLAAGAPDSPSGNSITENSSLTYLVGIPAEKKVYRFSPQ